MNVIQKKFLQNQLCNNKPLTISDLITKTGGTPKSLMNFFSWMYTGHISPLLLQGDNDLSTTFQGQPVVWDGTFCLSEEGKLIYEGYADAHGIGGQVERVVKVTDLVIAG